MLRCLIIFHQKLCDDAGFDDDNDDRSASYDVSSYCLPRRWLSNKVETALVQVIIALKGEVPPLQKELKLTICPTPQKKFNKLV